MDKKRGFLNIGMNINPLEKKPRYDLTKQYFKEDTKNSSKVTVEPFDRGYAVTVGNALRRTLLTALPGAAVTSVKIEGVSHEFSTIDGISEDVAIWTSQQKGLSSKGYIGDYMPAQENRIRFFHENIDRYLFGNTN